MKPSAFAWLCLLIPGTAAWAAPDYVGSGVCGDCHEFEYRAWKSSHHEMAMQHASKSTMLGDFNDAEFTYNGVTSRFFQEGGKFFIRTDGPDGAIGNFEIAYTFGVDPLQQYLVAFPDGRLQALSIAWDSRPAALGGQRWFHLYPDEAIDFDDELHWTSPQHNWNFMCADCHSTNLDKGYSAEKNTFETTWSEISVGCEACHGPGSDHARDTGTSLPYRFDERSGVSWPISQGSGNASRSEPNIRRVEIEVCAACHSRRSTLKPAFNTGAAFLDHFRPALLTEDLYHADGQILDEVYVWGSFTQSAMHAVGVTCSDCHDPHGLSLKAPGDAVCAQCHQPANFASRDHHHHEPGSAGSDCLDCHMPETTYMVVDPRRDHSVRIPRPDRSVKFGTPNACNSCHMDQTPEWAAQHFEAWYPDIASPYQDWTEAFSLARSGDSRAPALLADLVVDTEKPEIARATAVFELRNNIGRAQTGTLQRALRDESPLVRMTALGVLEQFALRDRYTAAAHLLTDPLHAVRIEAGRLLAAAPLQQLPADQRAALENATAEYIAAQELHADRPESRVNLGNLYVNMGQAVKAEKQFRKSIGLNPDFAPAYINLSDLYRRQGMDDQALKVLNQGIASRPREAALHHALGLALVRSGDQPAASAALRRAVELAPESARYAYVYGIALNSSGQTDAAMKVLEQHQERHPRDRDILFALATINRDRGHADRALEWARKLLEIIPQDDQVRQLVRSLEEQ